MTAPVHTAYLSEFDKASVFRASALFYAVSAPNVRTSVEFVNYWGIKRGLPEVGCVATVRDLAGRTVASRVVTIAEHRAYAVEVDELLDAAGAPRPFEGSVEVEIFASRTMGFAYPAMLALYAGPDWQSIVHTYTRTLCAASGDSAQQAADVQIAEESNWVVRDGPEFESFFVLHNGPLPCPAGTAEIVAYDARGASRRAAVLLPERPPFAATRVVPGEHFDLAGFLGGRPGWMIVTAPVRGALPRLLAGHRRRSDGALLGLTHSHHNSRRAQEFFEPSPAVDKPMFIAVPAGAVPWATRVVAFRTFAPDAYDVECRWYASDGSPAGRLRRALVEESDANGDAALVIDAAGGDGAAVADITLTKRAPGRFPTRVHLGVEFASGSGLPAAFTTGFAPAIKPRYSTYWFPVLALRGCRDFVSVINTDNVHEPRGSCRLRVELYRKPDTATLRGELTLPANGSFSGLVRDVIPGAEAFLGNEVGWCVMRTAE